MKEDMNSLTWHSICLKRIVKHYVSGLCNISKVGYILQTSAKRGGNNVLPKNMGGRKGAQKRVSDRTTPEVGTMKPRPYSAQHAEWQERGKIDRERQLNQG